MLHLICTRYVFSGNIVMDAMLGKLIFMIRNKYLINYLCLVVLLLVRLCYIINIYERCFMNKS